MPGLPAPACALRPRPLEFDPLAAVAFCEGGAAPLVGAAGVGGVPAIAFGSLCGAAAASGLEPSGRSRKSQSELAAVGAIVTGRLILPNPSISTVIVQAPSSRSGKL